jgi:nicotinamide mononucleotide transporter
MNNYEIVGVVFGLISVILTVRQSIISWPTGIISVIAFALLFFNTKLYADMGLQLFYVVTGFYGWYLWKYGGVNKGELKVNVLTNQQRIFTALVFVPAFYLMGLFLRTYTDAALPIWDSLSSTLSVFAQILLMKKIFENWGCWIVVDILSIGIYIYKGVYLTAGLYVIFLGLAITGFVEWYKDYKKYENANNRIGSREVCATA